MCLHEEDSVTMLLIWRSEVPNAFLDTKANNARRHGTDGRRYNWAHALDPDASPSPNELVLC